MPVAGTKQYQDDQQQEAEGQPCGQGAGCCKGKAGLKWAVLRTPHPGRGGGGGPQGLIRVVREGGGIRGHREGASREGVRKRGGKG